VVNKWHPETIKAEVRKRGLWLKDLDKRSQLPERTCATALYRPGPRGERAIAKFLGVPAHQLWPERYDAQGRRLRPQPMRNYQRTPCREPDRRAA
jgi:Ner family transcriptional regulator